MPRPRVGSAWTCGRSGSTGVPTVLASIDRPFVVERPDELGGLVIAPALTVLPYRRVYCAMITPLVVVTLLVSSNSVSGAGPSNNRAPLPRVSGQISSV